MRPSSPDGRCSERASGSPRSVGRPWSVYLGGRPKSAPDASVREAAQADRLPSAAVQAACLGIAAARTNSIPPQRLAGQRAMTTGGTGDGSTPDGQASLPVSQASRGRPCTRCWTAGCSPAAPIRLPSGDPRWPQGPSMNGSRLGRPRLPDLRYTVASQTVMSGDNLPQVGRLLGHRRHRTTAGCAHLADGHLVGGRRAHRPPHRRDNGRTGRTGLKRHRPAARHPAPGIVPTDDRRRQGRPPRASFPPDLDKATAFRLVSQSPDAAKNGKNRKERQVMNWTFRNRISTANRFAAIEMAA